jgi:hypothetical protein
MDAERIMVVVPQIDGVNKPESDVSAPSIIEGRPWNTMPESTCLWNARAFVFGMLAKKDLSASTSVR